MKSMGILRKTKMANKGITLVALVITVIILIILAGITIAGLTGEKGLIKEAKTAKELTELAGLEEQIDLAIIKAEQKHRNPTIDDVITELINNKVISDESRVNKETGAVHTDVGYLIEGKLDDYIGKTSTGDGNNTGVGNTTGNNNTTGGETSEPSKPTRLPSTTNTTPFLPEGAEIISDSLETGVIIKDENDNEWVWIEVPKSIYNGVTNYSGIETAMQNYASDYRGDSYYSDVFYSTSLNGFANETEYNNHKNSMLKSVFENGGFYIGRYETGTKTERNSKTDTLTTPIIQQDFYPYNYVTCAQSQTLAKQLETGGKTSSLMFGIQWDLVLKYIEEKGAKTREELKTNSGTWGNYEDVTFDINRGKYRTSPQSEGFWNNANSYTKPSSTRALLTTGATDRNCVLGIYDLAGNVFEYTLEKSYRTGPGTARGGGIYYSGSNGSSYPVSCRIYANTSDADYGHASRVALW